MYVRAEEGSALVEFISLMILLLIPIVSYFTSLTVETNNQMSQERVLREVSEIIRTGSDFHESISLVKRYLSLHDSTSTISIICLSGDCPHRESVMEIELRNSKGAMKRMVRGGKSQ